MATSPSASGDNDVLWTLSGSLFAAAGQLLSETQSTLVVDGKTWALCEEPTAAPLASPSALLTTAGGGAAAVAAPPAPEPPLLVTQHVTPARKFVLLTTQCCHVITQLRPVDILRQLLVDAGGPESTAIRAFFQVGPLFFVLSAVRRSRFRQSSFSFFVQVLREDQACATALILACSSSVQDAQVADWAAQTLFVHGGEVRVAAPAAAAAQGGPAYATPSSPATPLHHPAHVQSP